MENRKEGKIHFSTHGQTTASGGDGAQKFQRPTVRSGIKMARADSFSIDREVLVRQTHTHIYIYFEKVDILPKNSFSERRRLRT